MLESAANFRLLCLTANLSAIAMLSIQGPLASPPQPPHTSEIPRRKNSPNVNSEPTNVGWVRRGREISPKSGVIPPE